MLARSGYAVLSFGMALLLGALPTGNYALLAFAAAPLAFLAFLTAGASPTRVEMDVALPAIAPRKGDAFDLVVRYRVEGGRGFVEIQQGLPREFELVAGSNLLLLAKGREDLVGEAKIRVRALRRGRYELPPLEWEAVPPLGLAASRRGTSGDAKALVVKPRIVSTKRISGLRARGVMLPQADPSRTGIRTTDFRDIREYQRGDARKTINWKATMRRDARAAGPHRMARRPPPLVNDFETEGRKSVWIFLDCGPHMRIGTNVESAFEAGVAASGTITRHFVERGYRVGFSLYNRDAPVTLYPESGRSQLLRVERELAHAETTDVAHGLPAAVQKAKPYLHSGHTLVLVVSRAESVTPSTVEGLRALRRVAVSRARSVPMAMISIEPYGLATSARGTAPLARALLREADQPARRAVRSLGIHVIPWDPSRDGLHHRILRRLPA